MPNGLAGALLGLMSAILVFGMLFLQFVTAKQREAFSYWFAALSAIGVYGAPASYLGPKLYHEGLFHFTVRELPFDVPSIVYVGGATLLLAAAMNFAAFYLGTPPKTQVSAR